MPQGNISNSLLSLYLNCFRHSIESDDMACQELWKKYELSTGAYPANIEANLYHVDTLTSDQSISFSNEQQLYEIEVRKNR